jgi:hypothetical protein
MTTKSRLYYGDNLNVLRRHVADGSVDLIPVGVRDHKD